MLACPLEALSSAEAFVALLSWSSDDVLILVSVVLRLELDVAPLRRDMSILELDADKSVVLSI